MQTVVKIEREALLYSLSEPATYRRSEECQLRKFAGNDAQEKLLFFLPSSFTWPDAATLH